MPPQGKAVAQRRDQKKCLPRQENFSYQTKKNPLRQSCNISLLRIEMVSYALSLGIYYINNPASSCLISDNYCSLHQIKRACW